jgi:hypothetical protein
MLNKEIRTKQVEVTASVTCNICAQVVVNRGCGAEYATLTASWGYDSKKDLQYHEAHICEPCYDIHITPLMKIPTFTNNMTAWGEKL